MPLSSCENRKIGSPTDFAGEKIGCFLIAVPVFKFVAVTTFIFVTKCIASKV